VGQRGECVWRALVQALHGCPDLASIDRSFLKEPEWPQPSNVDPRAAPVHHPAVAGKRDMHTKLTVWYNTKCPVCDVGVERQRNRLILAARAGAIEFRDVNLEPEALARFGATLDDVRRRVHAVDADGRLFVGMDAALEIWHRTPGDAWFAGLIGLPGIRQSTRFVWNRCADVLFAWNKRRGRW
jgi:predicted DCC family thiol-disulfide oxidoreductase YuxK